MFKNYFNYQSPREIYNGSSDTKKHRKNNIQVNLIKNNLINFKRDIGNASKDDVNKIED